MARTIEGNPFQEQAGQSLAESADVRSQAVRTAVPTNPAGTATTPATFQAAGGTTDTGTDFQSGVSSILQTGTSTPTQATLINPTTGDRQAVVSGSEQAQQLFGQGYVLEASPGVPVEGAVTATETVTEEAPDVTTTTTGTEVITTSDTQSRIDSLRGEAEVLRSQAFEAAYGFTPDEWANLDASAQRRLRNQRVQGLVASLGNVNAAITQAQAEEEAAKADAQTEKENALNTLNLYLEYGVVDSVGSEVIASLAETAGLDASAIVAMSESANMPALEQLGSDLYQVEFNPETGLWETTLVQSGYSGGGGGGSAVTTETGVTEPSDSDKLIYNQVASGEVAITALSDNEREAYDRVSTWLAAQTAAATPTKTTTKTTAVEEDTTGGGGFLSGVTSALTGGVGTGIFNR